jgi:hypothetical protein
MNSSIAWPSNHLIQVLLVLIGMLFLYGLSLSWRSFGAIRAERRAAQDLVKRKGLILARDTLALQLGKGNERLAGQLLLSMLRQQGLSFARPSDALDPVLDSAARIVAPARTVPNLLLLFGLIGTVVGLAYTLSSLGPQIQGAINAGDPKTVAQSLGITLREMGGAFAGTLWGVTGAFLLQAINALTGIQAEQLAGDLDQVALEFAAQIYPAGSEKQIASLHELLENSRQVLSDTKTEMANVSREFKLVLQEAGSIIKRSLDTLDSSSKEISKALQQASGDVRQSSEHLTGAVNSIKGHQEDFRNIYSAFSDMFDQSMKALKLHSDGELKEIRELQTAFGNSGSQIVQEIFRTSEKLDQVSQALAMSESAYLLGAQSVTTSIKAGFDHLDTRLGDTLKTYTTEVTSVSSSLDDLRESMGASQTASVTLERTLRAKDDAEHARLKDQLQSEQILMLATARLTTSLEQLSPLLSALHSGPETLVEALSARQEKLVGDWRSQQEKVDSMMLRATLDTHERLETLLGALGTRVDQAAQRQQAVGQDVHAQTRELVLLGNGLLDQLTRQTEQLQLRFGEVGSRHPTLEKTVDTHQGTIGEINQTMKGVLDRIDRQIEFGERRRTETGSEQEALRTSLEQNRESALQLTQILEALPVRMQTAELVQSQTQLASTMGRLLGGLERDLQAQQGGQPA